MGLCISRLEQNENENNETSDDLYLSDSSDSHIKLDEERIINKNRICMCV